MGEQGQWLAGQLGRGYGSTMSALQKTEPEDRVSVLGSVLAGFWLLLLFLNSSSSTWVTRVCKVNVVVLGASLVALRVRQPLGCLPALLVCAADILLLSYCGVSALCSLFMDSVRNIARWRLELLSNDRNDGN